MATNTERCGSVFRVGDDAYRQWAVRGVAQGFGNKCNDAIQTVNGALLAWRLVYQDIKTTYLALSVQCLGSAPKAKGHDLISTRVARHLVL